MRAVVRYHYRGQLLSTMAWMLLFSSRTSATIYTQNQLAGWVLPASCDCRASCWQPPALQRDSRTWETRNLHQYTHPTSSLTRIAFTRGRTDHFRKQHFLPWPWTLTKERDRRIWSSLFHRNRKHSFPPPQDWLHRLLAAIGSSEHIRFSPYSFPLLFLLSCSVRYWLTVGFWAHVNITLLFIVIG